MSSRSVQVELPTGEIIWAVVTADGPANVGSGTLQRLDMEELRSTVRGVSATLRNAVDDLLPDEVQVEFGLELAVKTGKLTSMLAEAGGTAGVKITLTWKKDTAVGTPDSASGTAATDV